MFLLSEWLVDAKAAVAAKVFEAPILFMLDEGPETAYRLKRPPFTAALFKSP